MSTHAAAGGAMAPLWRQEVLAALSATAAMLPFIVTFGFIVFGSIGARAAQVGLTAAVVSIVIGGVVMAALGRSPLPSASPTAPTTLILGAFVTRLIHDPLLDPSTDAGIARLVAITGSTVVAGGLFLILLGALRLGSLARFAPQPVLAGFMNGIAILIVISQIAPMLGLPSGALQREGLTAFGRWQALPLVVAVGTALVVFVIRLVSSRAPAALIGLGIALGVVELIGLLLPSGMPLARVGALSMSVPMPDALRPLASAEGLPLLEAHGADIVVTALVLALIGGLQSVLSIAAMDQRLNARSDPNRELRALGATNVVVGLFGGLPMAYLRLFAIGAYSGGGRTWRSLMVAALMLALVFTLGLPLVSRLPQAVVAGIVVVLAWTLVDLWTRQLVAQWRSGDRQRDLATSLFIVAVVCVVTLIWGFVAGVGVGFVVTAIFFIRALNRSLVRKRFFASQIPSRRVYPPRLEAILGPGRAHIEVIELEGALFFGNAERLADEADATPAGVQFLVVDFRRVTTLDASGAVGLSLLEERLRKRGIALLLAGVTRDNRHGRALQAQGVFRNADAWQGYPDADRAVEAAELRLLESAGTRLERFSVPLEQCDLLAGLDAAQQLRLKMRLIRRSLAAGERLFEEGDAGSSLYLLTEGSISVLDRTRSQRYRSFSPGMCFGETAMLDKAGRSAAAVADVFSIVHELPGAALDALQASDPALAAIVYRNLARHVSVLLRGTAVAWRHAAG